MIAFRRQLLGLFQDSVLLRFLIIGAINTAFGYFVFSVLIYSGLDYVVACLIASIIGTLFNFKTLGKIVFRQSDNKLLFRFIGAYVFLYFLSIIIIKIGTYYLRNLYILGAISTFITASTAFFLHKYIVFYRIPHAAH
ncbi:MAG: GtrA family protein [Pseudomonadota bacterium]